MKNLNNYKKMENGMANEGKMALNMIRAEICKTMAEWQSLGIEIDTTALSVVAVDTCAQYADKKHPFFGEFVKLVLSDILDKITNK